MPAAPPINMRHLPGVEAETDVHYAEENDRGQSQLVLMFFHEFLC